MYSKVERAQQTVMLQEETTANSAGFVDNTGEEDTSAESFIDFEKMQEALRPYTILMPEEYRKSAMKVNLWVIIIQRLKLIILRRRNSKMSERMQRY